MKPTTIASIVILLTAIAVTISLLACGPPEVLVTHEDDYAISCCQIDAGCLEDTSNVFCDHLKGVLYEGNSCNTTTGRCL